MRTTAQVFELIWTGSAGRIAVALLMVVALSAGLAGCGTGSEALPSNLSAPTGGSALIISTTTIEDGVVMRSYSETLLTNGGTPPLVGCGFVGGTPPPGLFVNPNPGNSTCVVSGVPTQAGLFSFTVRAQDSTNVSDTQDFTVAIRDEFTLTGPAPDPLPDGLEDTPYNFMFTVTTDTVIGPNDFNQAAENGNGPITQCSLNGLPAGMMAVGGSFTANSCQIAISGTPNLNLGAPMTFQLTLGVRDTGIAGSSTPPGLVTQTIDLTIQPPLAITLITSNPGSTTGCMGGTFNDSTSGGALPDAVTGRAYGNPRCDLLFGATGGLGPYAWTDNSVAPLTPFACAQEGANNEFFRCNSAGVTDAGGTTADVTVSVMDSLGTIQGTDVFGHASHSIFVNDEIAIDNQFLPNGVVGQLFSVTLRCDAGTGACGGTGEQGNAQALYTWSGTEMPDNLNLSVTGTNVAQPGDGLYSGTPTAANTGPFTVTVTVTDNGNDTTPACSAVTPTATCPQAALDYIILHQQLFVDANEDRLQIYRTDLPPFDDTDFVARVDLNANAEPFRVAFTPNGTIAVVLDDINGEAAIVDVDSQTDVADVTLSGTPTAVVIGPATSPLANPDSWLAYVALGAAGIDVVDLDPNSGTFGMVIDTLITSNPADDMAITPTFAGPETRLYYLDIAGQQVCIVDAQPGNTFQEIGSCISINTFEIPQHIEITPNGLQALVTTTDNQGDAVMGATAPLVRIDTNPASVNRDTVQGNLDLGTAGCFLPRELRSQPSSAEVWVLCAPDTTTGDRIVRVNPATLVSPGTINLSGESGVNPAEDLAFNIDGSQAFVTVPAGNLIIPISGTTVGTAVDTTAQTGQDNITNPEGIDHIRDPQLNALIGNVFTITLGQVLETSVTASGGVQPYTWKETGDALGVPGTACHGLSLDPFTGRISGTAMQPGVCTFTVEVRDARGETRTATGSIEVKP